MWWSSRRVEWRWYFSVFEGVCQQLKHAVWHLHIVDATFTHDTPTIHFGQNYNLVCCFCEGKCLNNIINKHSIHVTNYINKILEWYGYNGASASVMSLKFFLTASFHKNSSTTNPLTPPSPSQSSSYKLKASCTTLLNRFFL